MCFSALCVRIKRIHLQSACKLYMAVRMTVVLWFPQPSTQWRGWNTCRHFSPTCPALFSWVDSNILGRKGRCLILSRSRLSMWFELMGMMGSCQGSRIWAQSQLWLLGALPQGCPRKCQWNTLSKHEKCIITRSALAHSELYHGHIFAVCICTLSFDVAAAQTESQVRTSAKMCVANSFSRLGLQEHHLLWIVNEAAGCGASCLRLALSLDNRKPWWGDNSTFPLGLVPPRIISNTTGDFSP